MEMVRWLLGNKVVQVVWGLGILAVLLAWAFGGNKAADHSAADTDTHAKTEQVADAQSTKEADVKTEVVAEVKREVEVASSETKTAVTAGAAAVVATAAVATQAVTDTSEAVVETTKEVVAKADVAKQETAEVIVDAKEAVVEVAQEVVEVKTEEPSETVAVEDDSKTSTLVSGLADKSTEDLLMMAREAYWGNGLDESAEIYAALIEREPNVIEHKGELGNVFWRQGFPKKAAELYADIAEPMIEKGNGERVSNMVGFIGLFFPERAANIRGLLAK